MRKTIQIQAADGTAEAYLTGTTKAPGVLMYMDAIGLRPRIHDMADRIASWGYTVLAPNVFYRDGRAADLVPTSDLRDPEARAQFFAGSVATRYLAQDRTRTLADASSWVNTLAEHAGGGHIAVTGYCMGARLALWTAGRYPESVAAVGGFHGGELVTEAADSPHRSIASSRAEYTLAHADNDPSMTVEAVEQLENALVDAGRPHFNEILEGAMHGYTMSDTSAFHAPSAERHFQLLRSMLERTITGLV